jgi:ferredoxin-type protein NapH
MFKRMFPTLARLRFAVQILMLLFTVYGSVVVGHYAAEKLTGALPSLSCAYDQKDAAYCILIPTQHQMHHRIGEALAKAEQVSLQIVVPLLLSVATFFAFFFVLGKAFCGWVCPLGTLQEMLGRTGRRFGIPLRRFAAGDLGAATRLRPLKWLLLLTLVFLLPLLAGMGVAPHSLGNPYCDICPSRIATTLLTGSTEQLAVRTDDGIAFALSAVADVLIGFTLVAALAIRLPFCRICPLLSFNSLFQRLSPMRLVKQENERCRTCSICTQSCPMDIPEIADQHGARAYNEDCTLCGRCAEYCPDDGVIRMKWGPLTLFRSRRDYYKAKVKAELPDGTVKPIKFKARGGDA